MTGQKSLALDPHLTSSKAWAETARVLREAGVESPVIDARLLVCHVLGIDRLGLLRDPYRPLGDARDALAATVARRLAREPVSRIIGERAFWGRRFQISPATLDPRADSETLVAAALEVAGPLRAGRNGVPLRVLDLGTGTGCLLLTLLSEIPEAVGTGVDISAEALTVAETNATNLDLSGRANFVRGNWGRGLDGTFDLIVSNPPYIRHDELAGLPPEVIKYDPLRALDGGEDGLDAYRQILEVLPELSANGAILFEVGLGQAETVQAMLLSALGPGTFTSSARIAHRWRDLSNVERVVGATT